MTARNKKILVVGELNVDLVVSGLSALPTPGQEILADELAVVMGSSSAIYAVGLARLGAQVDFMGKVGADHYGDFMIAQLQERGVGIQHVIRDGSVRTGVTIALTYPHDRAFITYLGSISALRPEEINLALFPHYRHLHVSSYFLQKGLQAGLPELFSRARRAGLSTSLDTGWDPDEQWGGERLLALLEQVDLFMPNQTEACAIARVDDAQRALYALSQRARQVVIKLGAAGAIALHDGQLIHSPAFPVQVVDTTGAGDSFNAGLTFALVVQELALPQALRFANACGAHSTTALGGTAAQPTLEQALDLSLEKSP